MSTPGKFVISSIMLLGFALALGFAPIYASGEDCGSAFVKEDLIIAGMTCEGRTDMVQYWAIVLIVAAVLSGVAAWIAHTDAKDRMRAT